MNNKSITLEQITEFSRKYNEDETNKIIENSIVKNGLENTCIDRNIIIENQPIFNIELPECKRQDQVQSHRCWIYAGLNTIKYDVSKNLNIEINNLELSNNYIAFFDKLEKSNNAYENAINLENVDFECINKENIFKYCVSEGGYWQWFVAIVNKYGIVPKSVMPNAFESDNWQKIEYIYTEKVKKDILKLIELKEKQFDIEEIRKVKQNFIEENYFILSKVLGEPKYEFAYEYKDKNGEYRKIEKITPIAFKDKFLSMKLEEFVSIANLPMYNMEYKKIYRKKYEGNVIGKSYVEFLNLPIEDLKELAIKQLKDEIPVWFGVYVQKFRDKKSGVLDKRLYNYDKTLKIDFLTKAESLNLIDISMEHAMTLCGVNITDNKPQRWKVEDSYGTKERYNGYYIMNDNYFDQFVLNVIINKKFLNKEQIELLKQEVIEIDVEGVI